MNNSLFNYIDGSTVSLHQSTCSAAPERVCEQAIYIYMRAYSLRHTSIGHTKAIYSLPCSPNRHTLRGLCMCRELAYQHLWSCRCRVAATFLCVCCVHTPLLCSKECCVPAACTPSCCAVRSVVCLLCG